MKTAASKKSLRHQSPSSRNDGNSMRLTVENLKLWSSVSVFVGAFCLFGYFLYIDYFPLFDLSAVASYLFSIAYVCVIVGMALLLAVLSPYLGVGMLIRSDRHRQGTVKQHRDIAGWMAFLVVAQAITAVVVGIYLHMGWEMKWAFLLVSSLLVLVARVFASLVQNMHMRKYRQLYPIVSAAKRSVLTPEAATRARKFIERKQVNKLFVAKTACAFFLNIWQVVPGLIMFETLTLKSPNFFRDYWAGASAYVLGVCFLATTGGFLLAFTFSPQHRKHLLLAIPASYLVLQYLLFTVNAGGLLPMTFARITKTGNFRATKVVLSPKACESVGAMIATACGGDKSPPIQLCNVHIMSRVGSESYLRVAEKYPGKDGKFAVRRLFIATADITAMQVDFDTKLFRLESIDEDLSKKSSECGGARSILYGDSAFSFDSFGLSEAGKTQLTQLTKTIKDNARGIREVIITGHADMIGTAAHNNWLAERRATEVRLFMERELRTLETQPALRSLSAGSTEPLVLDCAGARKKIECEAPNRRVEITIISSESPAED